MSFKQVITDANTEYIYSTDIATLDGALAAIEELLGNPALNDSNRANADALRMRLACKIYALICFTELDATVEDKLRRFVEQNLPIAKEKGYGKSAAVMEKTLEQVTLLTHYIKVKQEINAHCQSESILAANGKKIIEHASALVSDMLSLGLASPFGDGVAFSALSGEAAEALEQWKASVCGAYAHALERTVSVKNLDYRDYDYFPTPEYDEGGKANALILNTPFIDEARLYACNALPKDVCIVEFDASAADCGKDDIDKLFGYAEYKKCAVLISHTDMIPESNMEYILRAAMAAGKSGISVFIVDTDGGTLYDAAMAVADEDEHLSALDISASYITMPSFNAVCTELVSLKMGSDSECREKLRDMPFLGFMGLNDIVRPEHTRDWATRGKKISRGNEGAAKRYLSKIKASMLLIDGGWGEFHSGVSAADGYGEFDYDGIPDIDLNNIKKIVESNATVFGKCGMVARYCTTGTGDASVWGRIEREQMERRVTLAVKIVYRLLGVSIDPVVEISDKLENSSAGGTCYDDGKRIVFKYSECRSLDWMRDAIVHECFHALQGKLKNGNWAQWYYDNMGITYGRACEWLETRRHKYNTDTKSDVYQVHMYEADARAFEIDCKREQGLYWNGIDFA